MPDWAVGFLKAALLLSENEKKLFAEGSFAQEYSIEVLCHSSIIAWLKIANGHSRLLPIACDFNLLLSKVRSHQNIF